MSILKYLGVSYKIARLLTKAYSTSFSLATSLLDKDKKQAIYAIYGFVRLADEIVDSFHDFDKSFILNKFKQDLEYALKHGISDNPVLMAFADTVRKYNISKEHIDSFIQSMEYDLNKIEYTTGDQIKNYIYGSADVVGLMCLKVFCNGDDQLFEKLKYQAQKLGSAFQKVNFLRDLKADMVDLGRSYFPEITLNHFNQSTKILIEQSIQCDFDEALKGIYQLPGKSRLAVAIAYTYYLSLFKKIKRLSPETVLSKRIRISNLKKYLIIIKVYLLYKLNLLK